MKTFRPGQVAYLRSETSSRLYYEVEVVRQHQIKALVDHGKHEEYFPIVEVRYLAFHAQKLVASAVPKLLSNELPVGGKVIEP